MKAFGSSCILSLLSLGFLFSAVAGAEPIIVGSKNFTEGYLLGEVVAQTLEEDGKSVQRKFGIGGTGLVYEALRKGKIDLYVEYTGTIAEAILKNASLRSDPEIQAALNERGLVMGRSLGFSNSYALAVRRDFAERYGIRSLSDLATKKVSFRSAFSYEFMDRADGFKALRDAYQIEFGPQIRRMDHALVYDAIAAHQVDLIEVYSTDAKLAKLDLITLEDDRNFFPSYRAVILTTDKFVKSHPGAWQQLSVLQGTLNEKAMRNLNAAVDVDKKTFAEAVSAYRGKPLVTSDSLFARLWLRTQEHLSLVGIALFFSVAFGVPLGIVAARKKTLGHAILVFSSLVQTIPSLALLCFLIPFFGIGKIPALIALVLYGLLPVVVNTREGLRGIDPRLMEASESLSLTPWQRLRLIELPLASPNILLGIKTSAIIGIGTATLAALIGAGGYGASIVTGLALNDTSIILEGAIPSAVLALFTHLCFEALRFAVIPKGIRLER